MIIIDTRTLDKVVNLFWDEMQEEFFKVEVLQYYGEDNGPSLEGWLQGNYKKSLQIMKKNAQPWAKGKENIKKIRIHVVDYPLSDYMKWETEHYKMINIPLVGEEVYLLDRRNIGNLKLPKGDTMVFDKRKVVSNIYNQDGCVVKAEVYEKEKEVKPFLNLRDQLLKLSLEKV